MDLKPGDVVILKSGGHPLSVVEVNDDNVACVWMGNEGDLFRETLPLAVLELAEADPSDDEDEDDEEDERRGGDRRRRRDRAPARLRKGALTSPGIHGAATSFPGIGPGAEDLIFAADRPQLPVAEYRRK